MRPAAVGSSPRADVRGRLALALFLSALLHAALILGVRVAEVERPAGATRVLRVRLAEIGATAPAEAGAPAAVPVPQTAAKEAAAEKAAPEAAQTPAENEARAGMPQEAAGPTTLDLPLPPDPTYYPARLVDEHPVLVSGDKPVYPEQAARNDLRGEVIVLMLLNEHGRADEVSIVEARPPGVGFEESVIEWLQNARFKPAMRQGRAVKARVVYHVTFEP